jgi:hypothetical protein
VTFIELVLALGWLFGAMQVTPETTDRQVLGLWLFPLVGCTIALAAVLIHGLRATVYASFVAVFITASLSQVHAAVRLTYLDGDVAVDTLIYNTTSPDINELVRDLETTSLLMTGDLTLAVQVESCNSMDWPLRWYFREMPNVTFVATLPEHPEAMAPVIIGSLSDWSQGACSAPEYIPGYTTQQLVFRWHEPESAVYRNFAIAPELDPFRSAWNSKDRPHDANAIFRSVIDSLMFGLTPEGQRRLFDLLFYRDTGAKLNTFYVNVYFLNDVLSVYNDVRYGITADMRNNP